MINATIIITSLCAGSAFAECYLEGPPCARLYDYNTVTDVRKIDTINNDKLPPFFIPRYDNLDSSKKAEKCTKSAGQTVGDETTAPAGGAASAFFCGDVKKAEISFWTDQDPNSKATIVGSRKEAKKEMHQVGLGVGATVNGGVITEKLDVKENNQQEYMVEHTITTWGKTYLGTKDLSLVTTLAGACGDRNMRMATPQCPEK